MDFNSFQHSLFLGALGNAILNSLWQGFVLWTLYETIVIAYKNINAKLKHNLSVLFIVGSFVWFVNTFISNFFSAQPVAAFSTQPAGFGAQGNLKSSFFDFFVTFSSNVLPYLSIAYMVLMLFLMIKLFTSYRHVRFISTKNLISPSLHLDAFCEKAVKQLRIGKKIKVWISSHIEVPATIGFIKPVILIPFASINNLTVHQLEAIILHELSHIRRNDYLINLLVSVVETVLFFNPFVALFIKVIRRERENCCDDFVLQYSYDPHSYASALLRLEQSRRSNLQLALGAVSGKKQLLLRIKRITGNGAVNQFNYGQKLLALAITTGIFCSVAWLAPSKVKKEKTVISSTTIKTNAAPFDLSKETIALADEINLTNTAKNKKSQQILNSERSASAGIGTNTEANAMDEHAAEFPFENKLDELLAVPHAQAPLNEPDFKQLVSGDAHKFEISNLDGLNEEIEKGLKIAYGEIDKVNWREVENNIKKSFSQVKIDELTQQQKDALMKARKYLSLIQMDKQKVNVSTILQQIQNQQKLINDSLRAAGQTLLNQRPAKMATSTFRSQLKSHPRTTHNFSFNYSSEPDQKSIEGKIFNKDSEKLLEFDGSKFKIQIAPAPATDVDNLNKPATKRIIYYQLTADI